MRNTKAIYIKQIQSQLRNPVLLFQAFLFIVMVLVFTFIIGGEDETDPCETCIPAHKCQVCLEEYEPETAPSLAGLFTVMFVGLVLVGSASSLVLEDKTTQNLRFMTMAGVRPGQYLVGTATSIFTLSIGVVILFSLVGWYVGADMVRFVSIAATGSLVSILLGIAIGLSKAPGLAAPFSMMLGLGPMLSTFNDTLARVLWFTYTQQVNLAVSDLSQDLSSNFLVIGANGAVMLILFAWMHRKGALRW